MNVWLCPNFGITQSAKMRGSRAAHRANLIQLVELAPQHLRLEERRVTSRRYHRVVGDEGAGAAVQEDRELVGLDHGHIERQLFSELSNHSASAVSLIRVGRVLLTTALSDTF
jgi:hypothetical protein